MPGAGWLSLLEGATLSVLLALAGTIVTGYRFGDSNHGITVPILKRLMDHTLYPGDVMVATAEKFPTVFYRALGAVLPSTDAIPAAFFVLYIVAIAATLAGAYRIGRWAGGPWAGLLCLLLAIPVRIGLAGEALYRVAFSHSHLASALTLWAIVWFLEGRRALPLLVLSLGAYNHLLYSVYVLVPMALVVLWEAWERREWRQAVKLLALALVPLLPLVVWTMSRGVPMTPEWLALLRLRSSHHSFPSYFGHDLPEAAALLALAVLAISRADPDRKRLLALFLAGTALQFVLGTFFTEYWPVKAVLQYQPHRVWRFLLLLLRGMAAAGVVEGYRAGGLSRVSAAFTGLTLFLPGLEALLPLAVMTQAATSRPAAALWARVFAVALVASLTGWDDRELLNTLTNENIRLLMHPVVLSAMALGTIVAAARDTAPRTRQSLSTAAAVLTLIALWPYAYSVARVRWESGDWRDAQNWVRESTPRDAVLLTPPKEAGFRVFSERTIVAEWKDGTQQYFDDGFVRSWGARMEALGDEYTRLPDDELVARARQFGAGYIVAPRRHRPRGLDKVYENGSFEIFRVNSR
jgi:hypothetical protein